MILKIATCITTNKQNTVRFVLLTYNWATYGDAIGWREFNFNDTEFAKFANMNSTYNLLLVEVISKSELWDHRRL